MPLALIILKISKLLPLGGLVPSGAYIARPLLSAWLYYTSLAVLVSQPGFAKSIVFTRVNLQTIS